MYILPGAKRDVVLTELVVHKVLQSRTKLVRHGIVRIFVDVFRSSVAKPDRR